MNDPSRVARGVVCGMQDPHNGVVAGWGGGRNASGHGEDGGGASAEEGKASKCEVHLDSSSERTRRSDFHSRRSATRIDNENHCHWLRTEEESFVRRSPAASTYPRPARRQPLHSVSGFNRSGPVSNRARRGPLLGRVLAGGAAAVTACAVRTRVTAGATRAGVVVARRATAVGAVTLRARVAAVRALAATALVVVPVVLVVQVPFVHVVHVVLVDDCLVAAVRAVGVVVLFSLAMIGDGHGALLCTTDSKCRSSMP